jgi:hypothetical protein
LPPGYHVDPAIGLHGSLSRRLQRQVCRLTADRSFAKAREDLVETFGVALSGETLRHVSEEHGQWMARWQLQDTTSPQAFQKAAGEPEFTVDAGKANTREEGWKDLKLAVLQKREAGEPQAVTKADQQRLPEPTARLAWGAIAPSKRFCKSWRGWMQRVGVRQMAELQVLADGASWIWRSVNQVLTGCVQTLDFYHASQRLAKTATAIFGEGTAEMRAAHQAGRSLLLEKGWRGICEWAGQLLAVEPESERERRRSPTDQTIGYFVKHVDRLNYPERLASGRAIGSGVVEGQAKTMGLRLKARGARWRKRNVQRMTALVCVRNSDQWNAYWQQAA